MGDSDRDSGGGQTGNGKSPLSPREQDTGSYLSLIFVTGKASDKSLKEKRKTINGDDLLWSMTTLGFEDYVEPLKVYLQGFREIEGERTGLGRPQTGGEGGEHLRDAVGGNGDGLYGGVLEY
uniref:Transcription factor CBF/NF-Y/archaeal histone domain-containing protein n=1 Tax=Brassica oleracea TaxID=3712 RepID=A0A3P6EPI3_BRAOL|nr:unnamed protein product [Brassica oleracea]